MHNIKYIRQFPEIFDDKLSARGLEPLAQQIISADDARKDNSTNLQQLNTRRNEIAKIMSQTDKNSKEYDSYRTEAVSLKENISLLQEKVNKDECEFTSMLDYIPNVISDDVPFGRNEDDNVEIKKWGDIPSFSFTPQDHTNLGVALGQMDFENAAKMSGSRFVILKGQLAKLERAITNFMLDIHVEKFGYLEMSVPSLVKEQAMYNVGQLPKFADESFVTTNGYRLIPTAEVPLTNMLANTTMQEESLPIRYTAYSMNFRSEAGSAGKDTKGMIRLHQFPKVELVSFTTQEQAHAEHLRMLGCAEHILQELNLPYRVINLCSGDIGFASRQTYDIEAWMPAQNKYREISSCSNFGDFQTRRMNAKYSDKMKNNHYLNSLNGSGLAVGRTMVAILENYQQADGTIMIPEKLQPYMNGLKTITSYNNR